MKSYYLQPQTKNCSISFQLEETNPTIKTLYRGFDDAETLMFDLATTVFGIFGRAYPEVLTIEHIGKHKTINESGPHTLISTSTDPEIAKSWGKHTIVITTDLLQGYLVDVHKSMHRHLLSYPARMDKEAEHVTLAILPASIKLIHLHHHEVVQNPFYLTAETLSQDATNNFYKIFAALLQVLRDKHNGRDTLKSAKEFLYDYLDFYQQYVKPNPFNMTIHELGKRYPAFMYYFTKHNNAVLQKYESPYSLQLMKTVDTLGDILKKEATHLLDNHPYIANKVTQPREYVTCYEDPYAKGVYD